MRMLPGTVVLLRVTCSSRYFFCVFCDEDDDVACLALAFVCVFLR